MTNPKPNPKPKPKTNPKHKFKYVLIGLLCLSLILAVVFTVLPNFIVKKSNNVEYGIGIWKYNRKTPNNSVLSDVDCNNDIDKLNDCQEAFRSKCNTNKALSIIGIVANLVALILISFNMSKNIAKLSTVIAFVSYLIIMALFMSNKEGEKNSISSDCAIFSEFDYGPGFILCAICTCLTLCTSIMI